jgi:hypothetical protein
MGLLSVAPWWLGGQGPEWPPSHELLASVLTIGGAPSPGVSKRRNGLSVSSFRRHLLAVEPGAAGRGSDPGADVPGCPAGAGTRIADECAVCRASTWGSGRLFRQAKGRIGDGSRAEQRDV